MNLRVRANAANERSAKSLRHQRMIFMNTKSAVYWIFFAVIIHQLTTACEATSIILKRTKRRAQVSGFQTKKYGPSNEQQTVASETSDVVIVNSSISSYTPSMTPANVTLSPTYTKPIVSSKVFKKAHSPSSSQSPTGAPTIAHNWVKISATPSILSRASSRSDVNISTLLYNFTNEPTPSPQNYSSLNNGFIGDIGLKNEPTMSPSMSFIISNLNSSSPNNGTINDFNSTTRIIIDRFGLEFGPTTQSILLDNDAIRATEITLEKFLTSQIQSASNVTITAVDATFIPYSPLRGRILSQSTNPMLTEKIGNAIIYYQGEIFMYNNIASDGPEIMSASDAFIHDDTPNDEEPDIFSMFEDSENVKTFTTNLKSESDQFSGISYVMYAVCYPSPAIAQASSSGTYSSNTLTAVAAATGVFTIFACLAAFLVYRARQTSKVGDDSIGGDASLPGGGRSLSFSQLDEDLNNKTFSNLSFEDRSDDSDSRSVTVPTKTCLGSRLRPERKRQRKRIIKQQTFFDSNLSTITEGDCETEVSFDALSKISPSPVPENDFETSGFGAASGELTLPWSACNCNCEKDSVVV